MDKNKTSLIIFGITSDLAIKKLLPAITKLHQRGILPQEFKIIGIGRRDFSSSELEKLQQMNKEFVYIQQDMSEDNLYQKIEAEIADYPNRLFYLSTFPNLYPSIIDSLQKNNLNQSSGWVRIMIEKPIGEDLSSSEHLLDKISQAFEDNQVFLVDHYLGKEVVQNILVFRFANNLFEHLINKDFVSHIEITAAEEIGIENRGRYYDLNGALKDVGQNHLLQLLAFTTMDQPTELTSQAVHQSRLKLLKEIQVDNKSLVRGQYQGYLSEPDVNQNSQTETYFSLKAEINNDRFSGIPIYLRAGKKLAQTVTEISVVFKQSSEQIFAHQYSHPNVLTYRIQPNEAIGVKVITKKPGLNLELLNTDLSYCYQDLPDDIPDAYEKLLSDAIDGDQTFFPKASEVKAQWEIIDQLTTNKSEIQEYTPGSWGPKSDHTFLEPSDLVC